MAIEPVPTHRSPPWPYIAALLAMQVPVSVVDIAVLKVARGYGSLMGRCFAPRRLQRTRPFIIPEFTGVLYYDNTRCSNSRSNTVPGRIRGDWVQRLATLLLPPSTHTVQICYRLYWPFPPRSRMAPADYSKPGESEPSR